MDEFDKNDNTNIKMNRELIVENCKMKQRNVFKRSIKVQMQDIKLLCIHQSSFTRIDVFQDQLPLSPNPLVPHKITNNTPKLQQIQLPLIQTIANQINTEVQPVFNKQIQQEQVNQVQLEQPNKKQDDHHQSNLKPFKYHLIQNHSITQTECCRAIAFNKDNSIVLATCDKLIKVFEFKQELLRQTHILSEHQDNVTTLNFMKKSSQFISASHDQQIIMWSMNINDQWIPSYKLSGHSNWIFCLVLNNNEDLIISGSRDNTIKFWVKQNEWICSQTITDHKNQVLGLSLNEQQNQVISCGSDQLILIIEQSSQDQKWNVIQKISIECTGNQLCFINDNIFIFQRCCKLFMDVYEMNSSDKQYAKTKHIPVKCGRNGWNYYFPQQYIKSKCVVVNKNGCNVNLIWKNQNADFITHQSIEFGSSDLQGQMSEDGEYLITWDNQSKEIQIRKYHEE
ncbi:unnamed protein product [Paramecium octaurelia]|uniref:Uncharacterized protein n=1 Tax=Paramecium octaurelia TaxID=43137 RepID=A0A8S1WT02_PAROT|nr:unnamed protein product [Paramecium octaurelia]